MWRLYADYGRGYFHLAGLGVVGTLLSRLLGLVPPFLLGLAIDAVFFARRPFALPLVPGRWLPTVPVAQLVAVVGLLAGATLLGAGFSWLQGRGWNAFAQRVQHALRVDAYAAMQGLDQSFFDDHQTGELLSILNNDVNQLESFLTDGVNGALRIVALVVGVGAILAALNLPLALVAMLPVPALAAFTYVFVRSIQPKYAAMRASVGTLNARLENNIGGITAVKTATAEDYEVERVEATSREYLDANWDAIATRIVFFPALAVIAGLGFALTFGVGGYWVLAGPPLGLSGTLTPGAFVTFVVYVQQFVWPMAQFGQLVNNYQRTSASSARVFGLLNEPTTGAEREDAPDLEVRDGRVEYDAVDFGYDDRAVLRKGSLVVERGETLGIVGPTGAGKSTLVKLLLGLYDPDGGTITIDGQDLQSVDPRSVRRAIGYVGQEPFLFPGTVRENVAYGSWDASDAEVEEATRAAAAHEFVENLPEGYDTLVGERGVKLSGGQRQRVVLARAILADAPILVLDEATSHVDTETEALIQRSLAELTRAKTTLVIAHRLSTVRDADRIVVLDDGRIVESGTHEELLDREGLYANLWAVQAGQVEGLPTAFIERAVERGARVEFEESGETERGES